MIADDAGASRIPELKFTPGVGVMDQVVQQLTRLILPAFDHPDHVSELFADHISLALGSHIARIYGGMRSVVAPRQGGLAGSDVGAFAARPSRTSIALLIDEGLRRGG
jgi:AraC family transcriptional regulator